MRAVVLCFAGLLAIAVFARAGDCSVSKEFRLVHAQVLRGVLQDPDGYPLPGLELELFSGKNIVQRLTTDNQGAYDSGELAAGKYRIHIGYGNETFCAPHVRCRTEGCSLQPKLKLNPKYFVTVD
jgi:Carboxypeptidase regulatory-like domain